MRKLISVVLVALMLSSAAAAQRYDVDSLPEWRAYVPGKSDRDAWYFVAAGGQVAYLLQPSSIKIEGLFRTFWMKRMDGADGEVLILSEWKVNCSEKRLAVIFSKEYFYIVLDGNGDIDYREKLDAPEEVDLRSLQPEWIEFTSESVGDRIHKAVCSVR